MAEKAKTTIAVRASRVRSRLLFVIFDALWIFVSYGFAEVTYFRDKAPGMYWQHFLKFFLLALAVTLIANHVFGLYDRMWRHAGAEEAHQLALSAAVVLCFLILIYPLKRTLRVEVVPVTVILVGWVFATAGMGLIRFHSRVFAWQRGSRRVGLRVGIVGSRDAGAAAIREMLRNPNAGLVPVAVFDDDTKAHGLSMVGVPVVGSIDDIPINASRYTLQQVLLAIPNPSPALVERVLLSCEKADLNLRILPSMSHIFNGSEAASSLRQARPPQIEDLLGRTPIPIDLVSVRKSFEKHRVLVTGAGGSIGSEICRQVAELDPELLVLLDHDETHLHDTAATLKVPCRQALVDITDRAAVFDAFNQFRPDVVFHAAGHKHVPVLEKYPLEAVTTNVFGTLNVVEAAVEVGVSRFVQISSDKAVRPTSVMGATKWFAEQIMLSRSPGGQSFCTVRFGNVLGSRGSVIPTFTRQIANGGPVTVTDARMTRYFMSVEEAVQLVLESSVLSDGGGEVFMLEMGEPVRILDLAEKMIRLSGFQVGAEIPIDIVGARQGEKLDEELRGPDEQVLTTLHPYIDQLIPLAASPESFAAGLLRLADATAQRDPDAVRDLLFSMASTTVSAPSVLAEPAMAPRLEGDIGTSPVPAAPPPANGSRGVHRQDTARSGAASSKQVPA